MRTPFEDVGDFHKKFGLPRAEPSRQPRLLPEDMLRYRVGFMREELAEIVEAHDKGDLAGFLDGLVDLAWVAMGTAHYAGLPFDDAWDEVLRANMEKVRAADGDGDHKRGVAEVIRKPESWRPPDVAGVIARYSKFISALAGADQYGRLHPLDPGQR